MDSTEKIFNVTIAGYYSVGKTSLMKAMANTYDESMGYTAEYSNIDIPGKKLRLKEHLSPGKFFFYVQPDFYRDADAAIIVYSIDSYDSFSRVEEYAHIIREKNIDNVFLVENKIDLEYDHDNYDKLLKRGYGQNLAVKLGYRFYEVSALNHQNTQQLAIDLLMTCISNDKKSKKEPININDDQNESIFNRYLSKC